MKNFHPTGNCPVRDVLSRLGDKWSMLVLITLSANGTMRFSDIHKTIADVSQRMLTVTLRTLESDGLIERKVYAEVPPRVEYCLTERGLSLIPHIQGLVDWALQQMSGIMESRVLHTSSLEGLRKGLSKGGLNKIDFFLREFPLKIGGLFCSRSKIEHRRSLGVDARICLPLFFECLFDIVAIVYFGLSHKRGADNLVRI